MHQPYGPYRALFDSYAATEYANDQFGAKRGSKILQAYNECNARRMLEQLSDATVTDAETWD